jgi:hypothetical protein
MSAKTSTKAEVSPYYGFRHAAVNLRFTGGLTFLGEMALHGEYAPWAVYLVADPDREKGHQEIMLLKTMADGSGMVAGMSLEEFELKWSKHPAVKCLACGAVVHSYSRHSLVECGCENGAFADGGRDYLRCGAKDMGKLQTGTLDFMTGKFRKARKKRLPKSS